MKGIEIRFNIYAESEEDAAVARNAIIGFISENANEGRAVSAAKIAKAISMWKSNVFVKNRIIEYLSTIEGLGINKFTVSKSKVTSLSEHSYLWSERQIEKTIKKYVEEISPLYRIIQTLISEINEYGPVYPYHFNLKAEENETINNKQ